MHNLQHNANRDQERSSRESDGGEGRSQSADDHRHTCDHRQEHSSDGGNAVQVLFNICSGLRAGAESLWELAKASRSTVEAIRQANNLEEEPLDDRMLLIPVC